MVPLRPRPLVDVETDTPRLCWVRGRLPETEVEEGGVVDEVMEGREVNNSAKDERRR